MANELIYCGPLQEKFIRIKGINVRIPSGYDIYKNSAAKKGDLYYNYKVKDWVFVTRLMPFLVGFVCKKIVIQNQVVIE